MNYRELQQTLKRLRQEGKIEQTFKLNDRKQVLLDKFNWAVNHGYVEPPESLEDKVASLEGQVKQLQEKLSDYKEVKSAKSKLEDQVQQLQEELSDYKTRNSAKSELDFLLMDFVYSRGVGDNEIFESPEALESEPEGEGQDDWSFFLSTLKRRYRTLSKRYHPDNGGSEEQMRNLTRSYESALTYVKANKGMEL